MNDLGEDEEFTLPNFFTLDEIRRIVGGLQAMDRDDIYRRNIDDRDDLEDR